ncbi:ReoY family proteolytic degradation factor [Alteribacillus persepolensis]|uniref:ReoY family proteolytic degradation factor n=1 Tax=Alteribacillus persepolensis TaxID=568899 RepID=UPI000B81F30E|nr:ReoY family proteolytic degradation factor [Alteribacillus persepolensis]
MSNVVSAMEKRDFLKWFLKTQRIKQREHAWILHYLLSDGKLLEKVHFVEKAEYCPKAVIFSSETLNSMPFSYHKNQFVTMDTERSFHDIRLHPDEDLYVQLAFEGDEFLTYYAEVLEDNPYVPGKDQEKLLLEIAAEHILNQAVWDFEHESLRKKIDDALIHKRKKEFYRLTERLLIIQQKLYR